MLKFCVQNAQMWCFLKNIDGNYQKQGFCYKNVSTGGYSITVHPTCARARLVFPLSFTPSSNYKKQAYLTKLLTQRL